MDVKSEAVKPPDENAIEDEGSNDFEACAYLQTGDVRHLRKHSNEEPKITDEDDITTSESSLRCRNRKRKRKQILKV